MFEESVRYIHITSLAMWFGGLFGYVLIVWPSIMRNQESEFPRQLLSSIAVRTAPWIYLAMGSALISFSIYLIGRFDSLPMYCKLIYLLVLVLLIANNVYGSVVGWPRMMLSPDASAFTSWRWFYRRMATSLVAGLTLLSVAIVVG